MKKLFLYLLLTLSNSAIFAQRQELGFHLTPVYNDEFEFTDANNYHDSRKRKAVTTGVNYTYLREEQFAIRGGLDFGYLSSSPSVTFLYNSVKAEPVIFFRIKNQRFETFAGYEHRYYYPSESKTVDTGGAMRGSRYVFNLPAVKNRFQPNAYMGLSYRYDFSSRHALSIGLIKNWGLEKYAPGTFTVLQNGTQVYQTGFQTVTNYIGLRVMYIYLQKVTK